MKIAQVVSSFYPNIGGIENAVYFLSKELVELGHEVHVITLDGKISHKTLDGIQVRRLRRLIHLPLLAQKQFDVGCMYRCKKFDAVHIHSIEPMCLQEFLVSKYLTGKPTVVTLFSIGGWMRHPRKPIRITAGSYERIALKLMKGANVFHVKNEGDKGMLIKMGIDASRIRMIPDGIPKHAFGHFNGDAFRNKYRLRNKKIVLYVGRLHHAKGIHTLVKAMSKVSKCVPDSAAVLVGKDVNMKSELVSIARSLGIQDNLIITGYISETEKFQAYSACDVFVLPSLYDLVEAYSIVMSEAWAQSKPVVASAIGAITNRIQHQVDGLLVPAGDSEMLAEAIIEILRNPEKGKSMGEKGRKKVALWPDVARTLERIYNNAKRD